MPDNDNLAGQDVVGVRPDASGIFSFDNVIERLSNARDEAARMSNRFLLISLLFSGLALIKMAGLNVSLTLVGVRTDELQYGLFFFIVGAQLCSIVSTARIMDSRSYEHYLQKIIGEHYSDEAGTRYQWLPNDHEWLTPSSSVVEGVSGNGFGKFLYNIAMVFTLLTGIAIIFAPLIIGATYLVYDDRFIAEGREDVQYWTVAVTTTLSILCYIAYFAIHQMTEIGSKGGEDGDQVSGG